MSSDKLTFPFEFQELEPELNEELLQYFKGERTGFVQVGPEKYLMPNEYKTEAERYYNFEARSDDVWIVTFPRSGTTLTQELIWLVANNLDFDTANKVLLNQRFPYFEMPILIHPEIKVEFLKWNCNSEKNIGIVESISRPGYEELNKIPTTTRRFIKTHLPFSLLPLSVMKKQCKIIYVLREEVKNVAVSFFHLNRRMLNLGYNGDFERYWSYFERGLCVYAPYHAHVKEALCYRDLPNVLLLKYEDMRRNLEDAIRKVSEFLNCPISDSGVHALKNHLDIDNFRKNPQINYKNIEDLKMANLHAEDFIRKGTIGGIPLEFKANPELLERANKWIEENRIQVD